MGDGYEEKVRRAEEFAREYCQERHPALRNEPDSGRFAWAAARAGYLKALEDQQPAAQPAISDRERELVRAARAYRIALREYRSHMSDTGIHRVNTAEADLFSALRPYEGGGGEEKSTGPFVVRLVCCGRDDGVYGPVATWDEAESFRRSYISAEGHTRSAIIEAAPTGRGAALPGGEG